MLDKPVADDQVEVPQDRLMFEVGRRRHVVLPIDEFVPLPVVGELHEVVVCEPQPGGACGAEAFGEGEFMSSLPGMRSL